MLDEAAEKMREFAIAFQDIYNSIIPLGSTVSPISRTDQIGRVDIDDGVSHRSGEELGIDGNSGEGLA